MNRLSVLSVNRRRNPLLLLLIAILLLLAACGPANDEPAETAAEPTNTPAEAAQPTAEPTVAPTVAPTEPPPAEPTAVVAPTEEPTEAAILVPTATPATASSAPGVLRVGINLEFRPFVYRDAGGKLVGFDIDLINALGAAGDFEIAYVETPFEGIFNRLNAGEFDAAISAITVTEDRAQQVDFTNVYFQSGQAPVSYFNAGQGLAARADDTTILGVESLTENVRVGVKRATTGDEFASNETTAEIVRFDDADAAMLALVAGEVDAVILDVSVLAKAVTDRGQIKLVGSPVTQEEYAIAVAEGDKETRDLLNSALEEVRRSGVYDQLVESWFGLP